MINQNGIAESFSMNNLSAKFFPRINRTAPNKSRDVIENPPDV